MFTEFQVRQELCFMDFQDLFDDFQFDNDDSFDQQIDLVAAFNLDSIVDHRQPDLRLYAKTSASQFMSKTFFINTLQ